jgi:hypothetical protein
MAEGDGEKAADARLTAWLDDLMARLAPGRLRVETGETVADAAERVLDIEEARVRSQSAEPELRPLKLQAFGELRERFGAGKREPRGGPVGRTTKRPGDATYELTLEGIEETPLARLADLVDVWQRIVEQVGVAANLPETRRREYRRVEIGLVVGEARRDLVVWFHGTREMVASLQSGLKEIGIGE